MNKDVFKGPKMGPKSHPTDPISKEFIRYRFPSLEEEAENIIRDANPSIIITPSSISTTRLNPTKKESGEFWRSFFQDKHATFSVSSSTAGITTLGGSNGGKMPVAGSDWETWWVKSPLWRRKLSFLVVLVALITLAHLSFSIWCFATVIFGTQPPIVDPTICRTENCRYVKQWLQESMNESAKPCDDFYNFVCGNHTDTYNGNLPDEGHWDLGKGRMNLGGRNVLAEILRINPRLGRESQNIKYYQACMDIRNRKRFGLTALRRQFHNVFLDSVDNAGSMGLEELLTKIDASPISLEDMAVRMMGATGDFGFFDSTFMGYPQVNVGVTYLERWVLEIDVEKIQPLFEYIFTDQDTTTQMKDIQASIVTSKAAAGAKAIILHTRKIYNEVFIENVSIDEDACKNSNGPVDPKNVIAKYGGTDKSTVVIKPEGLDKKTGLYYNCLFKDWDATNAVIDPNRIKSSFAMFWWIRIIVKLLRELDNKYVTEMAPYLENTDFYQWHSARMTSSQEYQCFRSLFINLGYLPPHRHFQSLNLDADTFYNEIERSFNANLEMVYQALKDNKTPYLDTFYLQKGLEFLHPNSLHEKYFVSNVPRSQDIEVEEHTGLVLTDDHVQNTIDCSSYSISRAREWWALKHHHGHILNWNPETFDLLVSRVTVQPISPVNSVFMPATFFLEPYDSDFLPIRDGGLATVGIRTALRFMKSFFKAQDRVSGSLKPEEVKSRGDSDTSPGNPCKTYEYAEFRRVTKMTETTKEKFATTDSFLNVLAIKIAFNNSRDRSHIENVPYWRLTSKQKYWLIYSKLIGMEKYTEQQLFFIATLRHSCRDRPAPSDRDWMYDRYIAEINNVYMQTEEFAKAWKCPTPSKLNPLKSSRCF